MRRGKASLDHILVLAADFCPTSAVSVLLVLIWAILHVFDIVVSSIALLIYKLSPLFFWLFGPLSVFPTLFSWIFGEFDLLLAHSKQRLLVVFSVLGNQSRIACSFVFIPIVGIFLLIPMHLRSAKFVLVLKIALPKNSTLFLCDHRRLVEEGGVKLIGEKILLLSV